MAKTYTVSRENAAKILSVSTRTIDRYVKAGKLSYKKVANKVILSKEELNSMQKDFSALHQEVNSEIVSSPQKSMSVKSSVEEVVDEKIEKFFLIFKEKDKLLEEKNKVIFLLQKRVGELETKLDTMIALPEYNIEKQSTLLEKQKLEYKLLEMKKLVKTEKVKNLVFITIVVLFVLIALFFYFNLN
jgi:hypothetical protein